MRKDCYDLEGGWKPSTPPVPKMTGLVPRASRGGRLKADAARELLQRFIDSGDECWRKDYDPTGSYGSYAKGAETDAQFLSGLVKALGLPVAVRRRRNSLFLVRDWTIAANVAHTLDRVAIEEMD